MRDYGAMFRKEKSVYQRNRDNDLTGLCVKVTTVKLGFKALKVCPCWFCVDAPNRSVILCRLLCVSIDFSEQMFAFVERIKR